MRTVLIIAALFVGCSGSSDSHRTDKYAAAAEWCAAISRDGVERVLWVCHDDAPLVVACAPPSVVDSFADPCATVMVQP